MVYLNTSDSDKGNKKKVVWMAMGPERSSSSSASTSKSLHNFRMPGLGWGNRRFLRCMKVNSNGQISAVERRPFSVSGFSEITNHTDCNGGSVSTIGKHKERDSPPDSDVGLGSKPGFNFKLPPPPPSSSATEYYCEFGLKETGGGKGDGDGIAAVREKLMIDLQTAADRMKDAILREGLETEDQEKPPSPAPAPAPAVDPTPPVAVAPTDSGEGAGGSWNLRTRRAACKAPTAYGFVYSSASGAGTSGCVGAPALPSTVSTLRVDTTKASNLGLSPMRAENIKSPRLRSSFAATAAGSNQEKEREKFSVALSRREIAEDFMDFANRRPARRPQKRSKHIQKQLDTLFPGLWLTEITADMYKVPETQ